MRDIYDEEGKLRDIYDEEGKLYPDIFQVLKRILAVSPNVDKTYCLHYIHANNRYFEKKKDFCRYPVSTTLYDQDTNVEIPHLVEAGENEEDSNDLEEMGQIVYPPFDEQIERAHTVIKFARTLGLLQCNDAVVNLAAMIRYFEEQGAWAWNTT